MVQHNKFSCFASAFTVQVCWAPFLRNIAEIANTELGIFLGKSIEEDRIPNGTQAEPFEGHKIFPTILRGFPPK